MAGADAVAQMQVGGQHNIQLRNITWFVNVSIIMGRPYPAGIDDAEYGDDYRQQKGAASCEDDKMPAAQCMLLIFLESLSMRMTASITARIR